MSAGCGSHSQPRSFSSLQSLLYLSSPAGCRPCELLPGNDADLRGQQPEDKQGRDGSRSTSVRVQLCHSLALCPWSKPLASLPLQEEDLPPAVTWSQRVSWTLVDGRPSLVAQKVKNPPAMQKTRVRSLGREDPLEKERATHSSILAWRIP